jgi:hypothetical protein
MVGRSWKCEVITDASRRWTTNQNRYLTSNEAFEAVKDLERRWTAVTNTRVTRSDDPVNARWNYAQRRTEFLPTPPPPPEAA